MEASPKIIKSVFSRVDLFLILLNIIFVLLLYPVLLVIYSPFWLHRQLAILIVKRSDPSVGAILSGASANFAASTPYSNPTSVLIPHFVFSRKLDKAEVVRDFQARVVDARDPQDGNLIFPELQQRIVARWGYHFWKQEEDFRLEDHVRYLDPPNPEAVLRKEEISSKILPLTTAPFHPERSPWELILANENFVDGAAAGKHHHDPSSSSSSKSILFLRYHHALADGYSVINFMRRLSSRPWEDFRGKVTSKSSTVGSFSKLCHFLNILLTSPYHILKMVTTMDDNEWVRTAKGEWEGNQIVVQIPGPFHLEDLKLVKDHFGVNHLTSVLLTILAGALARLLKRGGVNVNGVDRIHVTMPVPLPGRPLAGLGNHFTFVTLPLHLSLHDGHGAAETMLKAIDSEFNKMRTSSSVLPQAMVVLTSLIGSLPVALVPKGGVLSTAVFSNFPVTSGKLDLFGVEVDEIRLIGTAMKGYASSTMCLTYGGQVTFMTGGDSSIFLKKAKEELLEEHLVPSFRHSFNELYSQAKAAQAELQNKKLV